MQIIYFDKNILDAMIKENPQAFKKCPCDKPGCDLLVFDNGFEKASGPIPENVLQVDFINRKRL